MLRSGLTAAALGCATIPAALAQTPDAAAVAQTYAAIAQATFADMLTAGLALQVAANALLAGPSDATLAAARDAWRAARVPYAQTEMFRFGNPVVDAWEPRVNSWPLDAGLIDCGDLGYGGATDENPAAVLNVIADPVLRLAAGDVDAGTITPALLAKALHGLDGVDANVATGCHAIEFLSWGQDLNGTGAGAAQRPFTDYGQGDGCTGGNCDRRAAYLTAPTDLLVADLRQISAAWAPGRQCRCRRHHRHHRHPHKADRNADRHGQPVLWRVGGGTDAPWPAAERSRGGAGLLFRQHPKQSL